MLGNDFVDFKNDYYVFEIQNPNSSYTGNNPLAVQPKKKKKKESKRSGVKYKQVSCFLELWSAIPKSDFR